MARSPKNSDLQLLFDAAKRLTDQGYGVIFAVKTQQGRIVFRSRDGVDIRGLLQGIKEAVRS